MAAGPGTGGGGDGAAAPLADGGATVAFGAAPVGTGAVILPAAMFGGLCAGVVAGAGSLVGAAVYRGLGDPVGGGEPAAVLGPLAGSRAAVAGVDGASDGADATDVGFCGSSWVGGTDGTNVGDAGAEGMTVRGAGGGDATAAGSCGCG